jgi:hypothetical protein
MVYRCKVCGLLGDELPRLAFNFLEGRPVICERCLARACGIEGRWSEGAEKTLQASDLDGQGQPLNDR